MAGEGKRFNQGKVRFDLRSSFANEQLANVLTMGAEKYGDRNWELGMPWSKVIASLERHFEAIKRGEDFDAESGMLHSAHVMTNAMFLTEYYKVYPQGDDRKTWYDYGYKVGLDIDDVLSDFCPTFCKRYDLHIPKFWNFDRSIMEKFEELKKDKDFWINLPIKTNPDSIPFEPTCYITSRSIPIEWTEEWLDKNGFSAVKVYQVGIDGSKVECAKKSKIDIFIDDRYDNYLELNNAGIFTYLFSAPHNMRYRVGHKRINAVSEVIR